MDADVLSKNAGVFVVLDKLNSRVSVERSHAGPIHPAEGQGTWSRAGVSVIVNHLGLARTGHTGVGVSGTWRIVGRCQISVTRLCWCWRGNR